MATETAPVNGLYGTSQYTQPAELAASTPSVPTHATSASQSTTASATTQQQKADPQEIGWYFVEQYYTTLSKTPEKIHLFYSKKSQLVSGVEAEKVVPAVGTKAISEKIKSLDFQDCKVRVLNVDSQASFNNIVVQVIGEMSNKSEPHHKFVQTFVLAEQPNGYFVLNDIFRYLSDDVDEIVEDEQPQAEVPAEEVPTPAEGLQEAQPHTEDQVVTENAADEVDEKLEEQTEAPQDIAADTNGDDASIPIEEPVDAPERAPKEDVLATETPEPAAPEQTAEPEATPAPAESTAEAAAPAPTAAAAPEAPAAKKTWASMLGGGSGAGGVQKPAVPALPISAPAQPKAPRPAQSAQAPKAPTEPASAATPPTASTPTSQSNGWQTAEHSKKSNRPQNKAASDGITLAYIRNVNEKVDARILREVLESFGELKYYDVSRPRSCAFVEFSDPAGYAAAVAANPHTVGTETIYVEERRPRPNAYGGSNANYTRGGGPASRGGRGAIQGGSRSGSQTNFPKDAGRGGNVQHQRGGKPGTGTITPKGRGQGQTV
ncbi:NTF2 and RRM domain protein [Cladophialophora carrionii]|uniref:NTF2 and RRM domain protein n=1 Tax=Cladophialophora carrionii TaxID=86049 RepID=A0A1C1CL24_9EURO|nr:NTF2 and RRM domain protein [Cladophialophora carrionii]